MQQRAMKAKLPSKNKKKLTMEVIHEQEKYIYPLDRGSHWNSQSRVGWLLSRQYCR